MIGVLAHAQLLEGGSYEEAAVLVDRLAIEDLYR